MSSQQVQPDVRTPVANFLRYWFPVILWMAMVFTASADKRSYQHSSLFFEPLIRWLFPHISPITLGDVHHLFRKVCHLTEYAIFGWLVWRAVRQPVRHDPRPWKWGEAGIALVAVFLYAASDEFHQVFVPTRTPLVTDVFIDTTGGMVMMLFLWAKVTMGRRRAASRP